MPCHKGHGKITKRNERSKADGTKNYLATGSMVELLKPRQRLLPKVREATALPFGGIIEIIGTLVHLKEGGVMKEGG